VSVLVFALVAGAVVGIALGALGGGGSVLAVPAMIYLLGLDPVTATTASLLIVAATSLTALARHAAAGNVRWRTGAMFAAAGLLPAVAAGAAAHRIPPAALTGAFAVIAAVAAIGMLRTSSRQRDPAGGTGGVGGGVLTARRVSPVRAAGAGAGLGAVTGLLGVGGGFLAVPTLVTVLSLRMRAAIGTSLLVIAVNSVAALTARLATTPTALDWAVLGPFAGAAILGAWDGKRLAGKLSGPTLQRLFAVLLLGVAVFMLVDAVR